jgi:hypothetical protein
LRLLLVLPCSDDSETPRSRIGLGKGISFWSKATARRSRSLRLETATGTDRLRVMISKSLNFTFIRDRDRIYGSVVTRRLRAMGIRDKPIAPASPWQNGFANG